MRLRTFPWPKDPWRNLNTINCIVMFIHQIIILCGPLVCSVPNHYLNQYQTTGKWILRNKLLLNALICWCNIRFIVPIVILTTTKTVHGLMHEWHESIYILWRWCSVLQQSWYYMILHCVGHIIINHKSIYITGCPGTLKKNIIIWQNFHWLQW